MGAKVLAHHGGMVADEIGQSGAVGGAAGHTPCGAVGGRMGDAETTRMGRREAVEGGGGPHRWEEKFLCRQEAPVVAELGLMRGRVGRQ